MLGGGEHRILTRKNAHGSDNQQVIAKVDFSVSKEMRGKRGYLKPRKTL